MDERDWQTIAILYEEKKISKAAKALFISQPALSNRIKAIEEYFGTPLIERTVKGISFTPSGERVAEFTKKYFADINKLKNDLALLKENQAGILHIGMPPILTRHIAPQIIADFALLYPNINFSIISKKNSELLDALREGSIHIAFVRTDADHFGLTKILLGTEPIYIASAKPFELADLPKMQLIDYRNDPHFRSEFQSWWQNNFPTNLKKVIHVSDSEACKEIVKRGIGFGFFPALLLKDSPELYRISVMGQNSQPLMRKTYLFHKDTPALDENIYRFVNFMQEHKYF